MMYIGRRIYYEKDTFNVLVDTGERAGSVIPRTIDEDYKLYEALKGKDKTLIGVLELEYGYATNDFLKCVSYRINPKTMGLEFSFKEDPVAPPNFEKSLEEQFKELQDKTVILMEELEATKAKLKTPIQRYEEADKKNIILDKLKDLKIKALDQKCNDAILGTFESQGKVFKFDYDAQSNFVQTLMLMQLNDLKEVQWKTEYHNIHTFTKDEFMQIVQDANAHKASKITRYWELKTKVLNSKTHNEVMSIVW